MTVKQGKSTMIIGEKVAYRVEVVHLIPPKARRLASLESEDQSYHSIGSFRDYTNAVVIMFS